MTVLIAGGGIGGLTAALACLAHGLDVRVFERAPALAEVGAGIQLSPNAMRVMAALGLSEALEDVSFRPDAIEMRMGLSGMRLIRTPLGGAAARRWGAPYLHVHRADLVAVLAEALEQRAPGATALGTRVTGYETQSGHVRAQLESGGSETGEALVGADGIHSAVRAQMSGPDAPRFTGNAAWRAVVPVAALGRDAPDPVACAWLGRGKHAVTYRLRGGRLANFVGVVERSDWKEEGWAVRGSRGDALSDFAGWHRQVVRLIEEAPEFHRWGLFDRAPLTRWTEGRAALLGDAAHPMLPFMAQGAAMAIEDAWALAAALASTLGSGAKGSGRSVPDSLAAYERLRKPRASWLQARSRANAATFHHRALPARLAAYAPIWLAGRLAPAAVLRRQDAVYGYDIVRESEALAG